MPIYKEFASKDNRYEIAVSEYFLWRKKILELISKDIFDNFGYGNNNLLYLIKKAIFRYRNRVTSSLQNRWQHLRIKSMGKFWTGSMHDNMLYINNHGEEFIVKIRNNKKFGPEPTNELWSLHTLADFIIPNNHNIDILYPYFASRDLQTGYCFVVYPYKKKFQTLKQAYRKWLVDKKRYDSVKYYLDFIDDRYPYKVEKSIGDINTKNTYFDQESGKIYILDTMA